MQCIPEFLTDCQLTDGLLPVVVGASVKVPCKKFQPVEVNRFFLNILHELEDRLKLFLPAVAIEWQVHVQEFQKLDGPK